MDHDFDGSENEIGVRPGEEGPRPPHSSEAWREARKREIDRLKALMVKLNKW